MSVVPPARRRRRRRCALARSLARAGATGCWPARRSSAARPAFPLTRPIARRRARALFDLVAGFVYSQVLLACVQLRPVRAPGRRAADAGGAGARGSACRADAAERLLDGRGRAAPAGAPQRRPLRPRAARRAAGRQPGVAAMVEHHAVLYADLPIRWRCCAARPARRALAALLALCRAPAPAGSLPTQRRAPTRR